MAQIPNLDNAPVNLTSIREQSQKELINILKNVRGKKCLVIDPKLGDSLSLTIQTSILKEQGVELRHLSAEPIQSDCNKVIFLVRSQLNLMRFICSNVHDDISKGLQREYHVYFVPRRTVACEKVLEDEKLHHMITIGEYPLYMVAMDEDVLSFELDLSYKECQVDGDASSLWHIAKAIHKLEFSFGVIPHVRAKGKASVRIADILNRMEAEEPINSSDMAVPEINTVILLDREVDMVTPLCSQLTYEGLIDEFLHINNGSVEIDASVLGLQQEGKKTKVPLNSSDKLFKEIRDLNFEVVVQILRQKATSMKQDYTDMTTTTQSVSELKDFVKKLNSLPEMTRHINLAQHLSTFTSKPSFLGQLDMEHTIIESQSYDICFEYIEELIHKQEPLTTVLRLLVLFSITNAGLPKKHFDYFRRELLHSYGFEHIATLNNLEKAGLFKKQESKSNWLTIKRTLQLVVEDTDTANPNDIAYVFSGYAPLSIRLIQHAIRSGWRPVEEVLKLLPGPHLETRRGGFSNSPSFDTFYGVSNSIDKVPDGRRSLVLVVFVGGVTFAEISALRFLSAQENMAYDLIIATTKIVNGQTLVETFMEKLG
ncbi:vacuolar protein-sorting-associated protein 33 homolog isoform X1 [Medicago truncatula]|uniref:Vacuolar protein sorting-associated protein n=1 Tax=Medicago truncatula TaxID=3880 RepID=A0A072VQ05_MEDTR|nr:vacuolar protein-sorting-associated protein 33 homolog isoform X1 [Medicago truncatula]KEH43488.1 vacuolar protein sorting-associated protein [Medicago truncatula]